ncbi:hypothetical protein MRX96_021132 [Rhipicephalus microplus]
MRYATKLVACAAVCIWGLQSSALLSAAPADVAYRVEWPRTVPETTVELPPDFPKDWPFYTLSAVVVPLVLFTGGLEAAPEHSRSLPPLQYNLVSAKPRVGSRLLPHQSSPFAINALTGEVTLTDALHPNGTTCSNGIRRHDSTDGSDGVWASRRVASRKSTRNRLCDVSPSGNCIAHGRSSCLRLAGPAQCRRRATCSRTSNSAS